MVDIHVIQRRDPGGEWRDETSLRAQVDKGEARKLRADMSDMHDKAIRWRVDARTVTANDRN